ncbi:MarR family transcriptional regulator [Mesorhizobium sp. SB112]|uniref:MarR family winged helix-turn-helix transcriptional regulator n=1 Tax=Mesorhizobium sp. SB112 TaxID=3151853 RepID=UPI00326423A7
MAQWRAARPDINGSGKAVVGRILHLNDIIMRAVDKALSRHGIMYPVYAVLATIRVSGEPYRMSPTELLSTLLVTSGGLSNLLRRMEADGYITRTANKRDGRGVIVELTDEGLALADASMADHAAVERSLIECLPPDPSGGFPPISDVLRGIHHAQSGHNRTKAPLVRNRLAAFRHGEKTRH